MPDPDYEYRGLMAETWDLFRGDTSQWPDRAFYLELIQRFGQPVLDIGCGTGRLLLDYMAQGIDVDGVDSSPEMLAICQRKGRQAGLEPTLYDLTMETLNLQRRYRTIIVPSSTLQLVTDPVAAERALKRIHAHLARGGIVAASFMPLRKAGEPLEFTRESEAQRPEDGATLRRRMSSRFDPATELEDTDDLYQLVKDGAVIAEERHQRAPATRSYTQAQSRALFERGGFRDIRLYHEFSFEPALPDDAMWTVVAGH